MKQSLKQYRSQGVRWAMVRVCAVLIVLGAMLDGAQGAFAQQTVPAKPAALAAVSPHTAAVPPAAKPVAEEEEATAKPSKPGGDGIRIHGHWVLQVKNTDGTLGERREFDNSLVSSNTGAGADRFLSNILTQSITPGGFLVGMITVNTATYPDPSSWCLVRTQATCMMMTSANNAYYAIVSNSVIQSVLTTRLVYVPSTGPIPTEQIVLAGNFVVPYGTTTLNAVGTFQTACLPSIGVDTPGYADSTPGNCVLNQAPTNDTIVLYPFTATVIGGATPAPLTNLTDGQVIQVTVTLSFS